MENEKVLLFPIDQYYKFGDFYFLDNYQCLQSLYPGSFFDICVPHNSKNLNWRFLNNKNKYMFCNESYPDDSSEFFDSKTKEKYKKSVEEVFDKISDDERNDIYYMLIQKILEKIKIPYCSPAFGINFIQKKIILLLLQNNFVMDLMQK